MALIPAKNTKGRGIDATTRGSARWERAARNALRRPHSEAAEIFRKRVDLAITVSSAQKMGGVKDGPWEFHGPRYSQSVGTSKRSRIYATCSTYCTVLQMTLDFGAMDLPRLAKAFALSPADASPYAHTVQRLDIKTLKRQMHCYVCRGVIGKK